MRTLAVSRRSPRVEPRAAPVAPGRLRPPPLRAGVIERPYLVNRLDALTRQPLTVVSAPTGFGKTTLLAAWAGATNHRITWASLGPHGLDEEGFWALLAAAMEQSEPQLRFGLRGGRDAGDRAVSTAAALELLSRDLTVVLDGYEHAIRAGADAAFSRFLDLAPETLHVVVSTRVEPKLALPLRRARGAVAELTAADLRLGGEEIAAVVRSTLGEGSGDRDVAAVVDRTEGWPAGVYLEALSRFSGGTREVSDYLRLELLDEQPEELRSFLLETSVLERLTAPLCDAFLGRRDSEAILHTLGRGGAFLVPLEGGAGHGYRYLRPVHEFLRAELLRVAPPERVAELHRRAASSCEREGLLDEAAAHARAGGGEEQAASLLSRHALELVRDGHIDHLESLLGTRAGAAAVERRPALRGELRRLAEAGSDVPALRRAAERVAVLSAGLPEGPVQALLQSTARAAQAFALLLSGSLAEAYETGAAAYADAGADGGAPAGQAAAVASLAASRLGLGAAAAPLARASASSLARRGVRSGVAALLAELAQAAIAEAQGDSRRAQRLCLDAVERTDDPPARTLALLQVAGLRATEPTAARAALDDARGLLSRYGGAGLLETLAAEAESKLELREYAPPARGELSPAEQRVLRLLATRLTQREVANELYVSLNTVKTHARVIYRKLGVDSRATAVAAARDLNLV